MSVSVEDIMVEVKKLDVRDGDILVFRSEVPLSQEGHERVRDALSVVSEHHPTVKAVVLDDGASLEVLRVNE